ncbi:hypothetical protein K443DRAFT_86599 [Laccaria amethystina LaAM-08-1]|uniref:MARVEL domain-containing protein n=1 Tax=Laccaria amethystina LaAM-08-1 TaxID=1095629 RepID=A0A0C9YI05_9AGAR|nr:hypothetical protein K443DRAFT_86599 [Laccaria amethystina LaAM-08-1]
MVEVNNLLPLLRTIVFIASSVLGLAVLAMSAHIVSWTNSIVSGAYFQYAALALATGLLTVLSLPALLMISIGRKGAVTSMIVVELCWLWFLWVMWVASAGNVASTVWISSCDRAKGIVATICAETQTIEALGFINWFMIMAYTITLLIFTVMSQMRGHSIWTQSVREADFTAPAVFSAPVQPMAHEVKMDNTGISQFSAPQGQFVAPQAQYPPYNAGTPVSGYAGTPPPQVQQQPMSPYPQV